MNPEKIIECRMSCGACCIAPSISSPIPGMPNGKPAGIRCIQLTNDNRCKIFGQDDRPAVCGNLKPSEEMCGQTAEEAFQYLEQLERETAVTK
jgi:Predicted Fe-S-cluster oxidoreductase